MQRGQTKYLFSYDASGNVVSVKHGDDEYYYLRHAQGDIVKLIDASGVSVAEDTYDTWGKAVTTTGTLAGTLGLFQPFRYRGYVYDWETGFYYLQSRYYDPTTGRFISADVLLSTGQGVLGHNCYAYCLDNPVNLQDNCGSAANWTVSVNMSDGSGGNPYGAAHDYLEIAESDGDRNHNPNCYSYALGYYDRSYDPGDFSNQKLLPCRVDKIAELVMDDLTALGRGCRILESYDSPIHNNEYRIAIRVSKVKCKRFLLYTYFEWDYHFMVQTNTGKWAEKHGPGGATVYHEYGNPATLSWDCGDEKGYYEGKIIYLAITD